MYSTQMEIPSTDLGTLSSPSPASCKIPRRLRNRLMESKTPSPTAEDIQAKLRSADLRRQEFYENLSSKARSKCKERAENSQDENLGHRIEAKLRAAAQKRLNNLTTAQMRLAKLDELRQAAKTDVESRYKKEREVIFSKVSSRFQQAEANRLLILKAYTERRATVKERTSQSLLRRMVHESRYKERVHATIHQKRADAEKKRLGLIEAEKKRACARLLQVRKIAKSVLHRREVERRRIKDQLENRLQRAKRQRAEYLKARIGLHNYLKYSCVRMHAESDASSKKIARCWRHFQKAKGTTYSLVKAYRALDINCKAVGAMPFDKLAHLIESTTTLLTVKVLLDRFELRYKVSHAVSSNLSTYKAIDHLLKKVVSPSRKSTPRSSHRAGANKQCNGQGPGKNRTTLSRYQVRVLLCAYMIVGHPDAVFNGQGELEIALAKSSENFVQEFENLTDNILYFNAEHDRTFRAQFLAFDRAWCSYLSCFVAWKAKDAKLLEDDLVRAACQLELSMIQTCKLTSEGEHRAMTHDMLAVKNQVTHDQQLLWGRIQRLSGDAGIQHMECALSDTRAKYFQAIEKGSSLGSQAQHLLTVTPKQSGDFPSPFFHACMNSDHNETAKKPTRVARALFRGNLSACEEKFDSEKTSMENELIVNELVHERLSLADGYDSSIEGLSEIKMKVLETMKKAFWEGVMESMEQGLASYDRIIELVSEMRDGICEIAPESWKDGICEVIDLNIFSQMLKQGELDLDYFRNILEFALTTLQKLSAPAYDEKMKNKHNQFLKDVSEMCRSGDESTHFRTLAMLKGLRFILEDVQALKQEISKARIRMIEPVLKGPAGLDYLKIAFEKRYGYPGVASTSLPLTMQWISSVWCSKDRQWSEYRDSLSTITSHGAAFLPNAALKTGHRASHSSDVAAVTNTSNFESECKGDTVDLVVRLGLVNLVTSVSGQTVETLPETFKHNLARIRGAQVRYQKIVVICTSSLICWQMLLSEQFVDTEAIALKCVEQLVELLDRVDDAGIEEIVEVISGVSSTDAGDNGVGSSETIRLQKELLARMLGKSLREGDAVLERVSHAVYVALRAAVLGGKGLHAMALVETSLRQVKASAMIEKLMEVAEIVVVLAAVSVEVHCHWYANLVANM